jgi:hypothetical protein
MAVRSLTSCARDCSVQHDQPATSAPKVIQSQDWTRFHTYDDILAICCDACTNLVAQPWKIMSIGLRPWATIGHDQ